MTQQGPEGGSCFIMYHNLILRHSLFRLGSLICYKFWNKHKWNWHRHYSSIANLSALKTEWQEGGNSSFPPQGPTAVSCVLLLLMACAAPNFAKLHSYGPHLRNWNRCPWLLCFPNCRALLNFNTTAKRSNAFSINHIRCEHGPAPQADHSVQPSKTPPSEVFLKWLSWKRRGRLIAATWWHVTGNTCHIRYILEDVVTFFKLEASTQWHTRGRKGLSPQL